MPPSERIAAPVAAAAAAAPATGKYVPRFRREGAAPEAPHPEPARSERWGRQDDRPPLSSDRWGRPDDRRSDDRRPSFGSASRLPSSSSWSSSRRG